MDKEEDLQLNVSAKRLREFKEAVETFAKTRGTNDLSEVANKLANIYSDVFGFDCVLKVSRRS